MFDCQSTSYSKLLKNCLNRLQNICAIKFKDRELRTLENLRRQRNKIEHFSVNENIEALKSILSKVLSITINFVDTELNDQKFSQNQLEYYSRIRIKSTEFKKFVDLRLAQFKDRIDKEPWLKNCNHCYQKTVVFDKAANSLKCLFCNQTDSSKIIKCSECLTASLLLDGWDMTILCLNCNYSVNHEDAVTNYIEKVNGHSFHMAYMDGDTSAKS